MENLTASKLTPAELVAKLQQWEARKMDLIVPANNLTVVTDDMDRQLLQFSTRPELIEPSRSMHGQLALKIGVPFNFYQRLLNENPSGLFNNTVDKLLMATEKNFLIRMFNPEENGGISIGRAFLSDKYKTINHVSILTTIMRAVMDSKIDIMVESCDVSEKRMVIRFYAPEVIEDATAFLEKYRNPETGAKDNGIIAGFSVSNSETGHGSFCIAPRVIIGACSNGLIFMNHAVKKIHIGMKLDEGDITFSKETQQKTLDLIMSASADYVKDFTSNKFLKRLIDEVTEVAQQKLLFPVDATVNMCGELSLNVDQVDEVMKFFIESGENSRGGAINAATFFAHKQDDPDLRYEIESKAVPMLEKFAMLDKKISKK